MLVNTENIQTMDNLNLALGIIGVILGIISARSTFSEWVANSRTWLSERAMKAVASKTIRRTLAMQDPGYLIALIAHDLLISLFLLWISIMLDPTIPSSPDVRLAFIIARSIAILPAGFLVSYRAGFCAGILESKNRKYKLDILAK